MPDPYVYPDTAVLINKQDIRDEEALSQLEREVTSLKSLSLPKDFKISDDGYRAIHRFIFEDLYGWAGDYRTVNISKGNSPFCFVAQIQNQMKQRFDLILSDPNLLSGDIKTFSSAAAEHINELNAIHPFREGNGRIMRLFLRQLADRAKLVLSLSDIAGQEWIEATIIGFRELDNQPLAKVIADTIHLGQRRELEDRIRQQTKPSQNKERDQDP